MKIDKYDMALANGAAQDDFRPVLTQICVKDGKLAVVDGFMLICRQADLEADDGFNKDEQVLIPAKMANNIKPTAKKPAKLTIKDKEITATYFSESGQPVDPKLPFKADMNATFPNYPELFPRGKKYYEYALSISLLRKLFKCLPKDGTLRLGFQPHLENGTPQSMEFIVTDGNCIDQAYNSERPIYGLIMPMFVQWQGNEWQRANEKEVKEEQDAADKS